MIAEVREKVSRVIGAFLRVFVLILEENDQLYHIRFRKQTLISDGSINFLLSS